jgi:hypothetical protein
MSADSKDPDERIHITFPFADELNGATVSSIDYVTMAVVNGTDAAVASMLDGAAVISGSDVIQAVIGGVDTNHYKSRCRATLSDGRKLVRALDLPVRAR